jgi:prevent-host-death family protein
MSINALKKPLKNANWQIQEAKAMLSEVVKASAKYPQIITVHKKETAVIISFDEYKKLTRAKPTLYRFIQNSPLRDLKLELPQRQPEADREVFL